VCLSVEDYVSKTARSVLRCHRKNRFAGVLINMLTPG
jgi:hypothetical protein